MGENQDGGTLEGFKAPRAVIFFVVSLPPGANFYVQKAGISWIVPTRVIVQALKGEVLKHKAMETLRGHGFPSEARHGRENAHTPY